MYIIKMIIIGIFMGIINSILIATLNDMGMWSTWASIRLITAELISFLVYIIYTEYSYRCMKGDS